MSELATQSELNEILRSWARGDNPLVAATELLIRTGWADSRYEWIKPASPGRWWIDFEEIPELIGYFSSGEQALLRISAAIARNTDIKLGDELARLDKKTARLVMTAVAHAAGFGDGGYATPPLSSWLE